MSRFFRAGSVAGACAVGLLLLPGAALAVPHSSARGLSSRHVCGAPASGAAGCDSRVVTTASGRTFNAKPSATSSPAGYHPLDLRTAYNLLSATGGSGQTVAIVDAYNDPNAAGDVATYRSTFGLSKLATCTVTSKSVTSPGGPCFAKVSQTGSTTLLPRNNGGWSQEISLDLDMVSAICPNCNILLVESSSASMTSLGTAVNEAAHLGATEISNSYGGGESSSDPTYDSTYFNHTGIPITASTGDSGYGVQYPAASPNVTAVGGTSLNQAPSTPRGWTETAWSGAGSGCSRYDAQPSWQAFLATAGVCSKRAVADVSADADPNTGVSVYDTYSYQGYSGWMVFGGTSVASPITASVYALANGGASTAAALYGAPGSDFNDVTSGSNGSCSSILCNAAAGWDGPTGLGTPNGTGAF